MKIEVYSDGSATVATKPGGYGWVMIVDGVKHSEGNGHMEAASNIDAELAAAVHGLCAALKFAHNECRMILPEGQHISPLTEVTLWSDNQTVLGWASGAFKCKQESKQEKVAVLQRLMRMLNGAKPEWVKGHSGNVHNERCDELANLGRHKLSSSDELPKKKSKRSERVLKTRKPEITVQYQGEDYTVNFTSLTVTKSLC